MASMTMTTIGRKLPLHRNQSLSHKVFLLVAWNSRIYCFSRSIFTISKKVGRTVGCVAVCNARESQRLSFSYGKDSRRWPFTVQAVGPGLEASISDRSKNDIRLDNVKIAVESMENDKITVRVDLTGEETQKAFDTVLTNLARTAPPIPGFRKMKGGKTSNVPRSFLLQMLGRDRVTKFLIQEVVSVTIGDYVRKENLKVKSEFKTIQTAEELEAAFSPGSEFWFNAVVDIESSMLKPPAQALANKDLSMKGKNKKIGFEV